MRVRSLATLCALSLAAGLVVRTPLRAQPSPSAPESRIGPVDGDHRFRWMLIGALSGASLAFGYYHLSESGARSGRCGPWNCALPYLSISGALTGLFMSRELAAQRRATSPRAGDALEFTRAVLRLNGSATAIVGVDSLVFAATDSGVQAILAGPRPVAMQRRATGLSALRSIAASGRGAERRLLIGTESALWRTPIDSGRLNRLMNHGADVVMANERTIVAAQGTLVEIRRTVNGNTIADTLPADAAVSAAHHDALAKRWWLASDSSLLEIVMPADGASDQKPRLERWAPLAGPSTAIATSGSSLAVARGAEGVRIWRLESLSPGGGGVGSGGVRTAPVDLRGEPRFAFGVAFLGGDLYVASGVDGVTRISMSGEPRLVGSSRQVGYATTITAHNGALWVGDRSGSQLVRLVP